MQQWSVLVPVRSGGKTRLNAQGDWARACALDTLDAISGCPLVASITILGDLESDFPAVPDLGTGLNNELSRTAVTLARPLAIVLGDLPTLTSEDFEQVLVAAGHVDKGVVIDHLETGTTMITLRVEEFTPHFGQGSAALHLADGYISLAASDRARLDVDTQTDLEKALAMGLGKETSLLASRR